MTARVGIRDLRNNTRAVIEQARQVGEVVLTGDVPMREFGQLATRRLERVAALTQLVGGRPNR